MTSEAMGVWSERRRAHVLALALGCALAVSATQAQAQDDKKDAKDAKDTKKASIALKVVPPIAFSPARMVVTAELKGGSDDTDEYYCPGLEWDWGDGTESSAAADCTPFEAGKSTIVRRWTATHTFETAGQYRIVVRLQRGKKTIVGGNISVQVKPGVRDQSEPFN